MDIPGVHIDGAVLLALLGVINTVVLAYIARTTTRTHNAVNGMQEQKVSDAHQLGVDEGTRSLKP